MGAGPAPLPMAWNGWGDPARKPELKSEALSYLSGILGPIDELTPSVAQEVVVVGPSRLPPQAKAALVAVVGEAHVRTDDQTRLQRSGGKSYPDLVRRRGGDAHDAPDAVIFPGTETEIADLLRVCVAQEIAVVPFGGGTSVVGGVQPLRGRFSAVIALDLARLDSLVSCDPIAMTATLQPGLRGPSAEALLNERGLTLGHFPQSYEHASIGGYAATRSAGQASAGFGRSNEMITALRMVTPTGMWSVGTGTPNAAGPDLLQVAVGSEGTLGVISEVTMRVKPLARSSRYEGWFFPSFESGAAALRELEQSQAAPTVARLSDEFETQTSLLLAGLPSRVRDLLRRYLGLRKIVTPCLAIMGWVGSADEIQRARAITVKVLKAHGGVAVGKRFGDGWEHGRYTGPYLRDALMDRGVLVETLETATTWSNLEVLHRGVRTALASAFEAQGGPCHVLCHISHIYPTGASLYFTFFAKARAGAELEQWRAAKTAACEAIVAAGATITHHHAVGTDHRNFLGAEIGEVGVRILASIKAEVDPLGILNPGKLLPMG